MKFSTIALAAVLAIGGNAFAATHSNNSSTKHAVKGQKHHTHAVRHARHHQRDMTTTTRGAGAEPVASTSREGRIDQALQKFRSHS